MSETLGSYIRIMRISRQLSVTQLSRSLGISAETMEQIEDDDTRPEDYRLEEIAKLIGGDLDTMLRLNGSLEDGETRLRVQAIKRAAQATEQ